MQQGGRPEEGWEEAEVGTEMARTRAWELSPCLGRSPRQASFGPNFMSYSVTGLRTARENEKSSFYL